MTEKQRQAADLRIRHAMASLVGNPEFAEFINIIREHRERAIEDACHDQVVANQRTSMAAIGEVRAYKSIIAVYDEFVAQAAEGRLEPTE